VGRRFLLQDLPQNIVGITIAPQAKPTDVSADLVLQLIQSHEAPNLVFSRNVVAEVAPVNREMVRDKGEKNLFLRVGECNKPVSDFVIIHKLKGRTRMSDPHSLC
jgi:hypothetical protein